MEDWSYKKHLFLFCQCYSSFENKETSFRDKIMIFNLDQVFKLGGFLSNFIFSQALFSSIKLVILFINFLIILPLLTNIFAMA